MAKGSSLDFASKHNLMPQNEDFPMSAINQVLARSN